MLSYDKDKENNEEEIMFFINSDDGVKLAVYVLNPQCERTVFLLHGWPLSHEMYEYQVNLLVKHNYRVILMDIRGFGNSDAPACGYSFDTLAADVYRVVHYMGLYHFILVGFSMGGAIVLRYMNNYRAYGVRKLILLAAAAPSWTRRPGYPYGLTREYVDGLIEQAETDRPQLARDFSHKQLFASPQSEAVKDWFEDIALSASGIGTVQAAFSLRDEDGRKDLLSVNVPTTIIHGCKDTVVSNELAEIQHDSIPGSKLYQLENSGHGIVYDELERFNHIFLKEVSLG